MFSISLLFVLTLQVPAEPGDNVKTYLWPKQKTVQADKSWGSIITTIEEHLPSKYGTKYRDKDWVTWGHETTHGINSELRTHGPGGAFYVYPDRAVFITQPKCTLQQVAAVVPKSLRNSRYNTYLISQQKDWNHEPLYIFDEWSAYINGALVGFEHPGQPSSNTDIMIAPMEFVYYGLSLALVYDRIGCNDVQFREFLAWNIRSSIIIYDKGLLVPGYKWKTDMRQKFATSPDCKDLRDLVVRWYGQAFYDKYLGGGR